MASHAVRQPAQDVQGRAASPPADIYRDSLLRYVAFTSDLGESFKPFISRRLYLLSYGVVAAYGLADTLDKGRKAAQRLEAPASGPAASGPRTPRQLPFAAPLAGATALCESAADLAGACLDCLAQQQPMSRQHLAGSAREQQSAAVPVAAAVLDTALWHGAASLAIPGVMINRSVWATTKLLSRMPRLPHAVRSLGPSALGLALIPQVVPHVDEGVSKWMDKHVRPHLQL